MEEVRKWESHSETAQKEELFQNNDLHLGI